MRKTDYAVATPTVSSRLWQLRPWNRNPLLRPADRVWSAAVLSAAALCALVMSIALAVGTAGYSAAAARIHTRDAGKTAVSAVVLADPVFDRDTHRNLTPVRWHAGDHEQTALVPIGNFPARGATEQIWLTADGAPTDPPAPPGTAVVRGIGDGIATAVAGWAVVWIALAAVRSRVDRRRRASWHRPVRVGSVW